MFPPDPPEKAHLNWHLLTNRSNAAIFPIVYFFFPETRYRSLEEMDDIFKKSSNIFNVVDISIREPHRYDKHGQLKAEFVEEIVQHEHREHKQEHLDSSS